MKEGWKEGRRKSGKEELREGGTEGRKEGKLIQLKAFWGGHTAAHSFMLSIKFPIGERKHAIRSRRLHEDEIMAACIARSNTEMVLLCFFPTEGGAHFFSDNMRPDAMRFP